MHCQRSDEIMTTFFHVRLARIEYIPSPEKVSALLDIQFIENVDLQWSANLHLKILAFVRAVKGFREDLKTLKNEEDTQKTEGKKRVLDWKVSFKGETNLELILSKENNMLFSTGESIYK